MPKQTRYFRYEVTHVFGSMEGRLEVGSTLIHTWHGKSHTWRVFDLNAVKAKGGYSGKLLGEVTEPAVLLKLKAPT